MGLLATSDIIMAQRGRRPLYAEDVVPFNSTRLAAYPVCSDPSPKVWGKTIDLAGRLTYAVMKCDYAPRNRRDRCLRIHGDFLSDEFPIPAHLV